MIFRGILASQISMILVSLTPAKLMCLYKEEVEKIAVIPKAHLTVSGTLVRDIILIRLFKGSHRKTSCDSKDLLEVKLISLPPRTW